MPAPSPVSPRPPRSRRSADALERLYAYWLVSTVVLLLIVIVTAILTRGPLRVQADRLDALTARLNEVEAELRALRAAPSPVSGVSSESLTPSPVPPMDRPVEPRTPPAESPAPSPGEPVPSPTAGLVPEESLRAELDALLGEEPGAVEDLADQEAAQRLVDWAMQQVGRATWSAATWARLAILSRLLGRDVAADTLIQQAADGGAWRTHFAEVSARSLLDRGRPGDSLPFIDEMVQRLGSPVTAQVLRARALLAADDPAGADRVLESLLDPAALSIADQLRLARLWLALERWDLLDTALTTLTDVPEELSREHAFLVAAARARTDREVEALAILDWLRANLPPPAAPSAWPVPQPSQYEIEVWRGVALMLAHQVEPGRQALRQAAELDPARADALYYLGVLEARAGRAELAIVHLKNALAGSARLAPAWEALAGLELDAGRVDEALDHLGQALRINPRRASAYFLQALAHAKVSQVQPAAEALRNAIRLDPQYLEAAKQADVLVRLFPPEELDRLAAEAAESTEEL